MLFCGVTELGNGGGRKKVNLDIEPPKKVDRSLYYCGPTFKVEALKSMVEVSIEDSFGFVVVDGRGALFGRVCGADRAVLHRFPVNLPSKHGRGGQSANRFMRLAEEARHAYVGKVSEAAASTFLGVADGGKANVRGLILAGSAEMKSLLTERLDKRLKSIVIKHVDVAYGGMAGFNQAIELASDCMANVRLVQEKQIISEFFDFLARHPEKACLGPSETLKALELGAVGKVIADASSKLLRVVTTDGSVLHSTPEKIGALVDVEWHQPLLEWLVERHESLGIQLELVSDRSQEGNQLVAGFGGVVGVLRYEVALLEGWEENQGDDGHEEDDIDINDY